MRKLFLTVTTLLTLTLATQAQKKQSGAIQFETTIDAVATAVANGVQLSDEMKARMPKAMKTNFELLYTPTNASYMIVEEFEDSNGGGGGGNNMGRMMMRMGGAGGAREYFYTFADQKLVEVFELSDTTYAMQSKLTVASNMPANFNMGGQRPNNPNAAPASTSAVQFLPGPPTMEVEKSDETKTILGFTCNKVIVKSIRKATVLGMEQNVVDETVLWYTKDLGFNFSPNPNLWTEGTVLAIENKGTSTIAKGIEYRNVSTKDVTAPKKAVSITADEYKVKMENMMKRFSGGGNRQGGAPARMIIN